MLLITILYKGQRQVWFSGNDNLFWLEVVVNIQKKYCKKSWRSETLGSSARVGNARELPLDGSL